MGFVARRGSTGTVPTDTATEQKQEMTSVNASYDLGMAKFFYKYGKVQSNQVAGGSAATDGEATYNIFGVRAPVGKITFLANYAKGDYESIAGTTSYDDSGYQLGAEYAFSKRTKAYAIYGATSTDKTATVKEKDTQMAVGLIHNF